MKGAAPSRRDRLRQMLADLRMPGALEALDGILHGVDGATLTAPEAIEQLLGAQIQLRNNRLQAAMRSRHTQASHPPANAIGSSVGCGICLAALWAVRLASDYAPAGRPFELSGRAAHTIVALRYIV